MKTTMRKKRRIRCNAWGNTYGYEGATRAKDFGTDELAAARWLADAVAFESEAQQTREWIKATFKTGKL
jgi:hypothetical protein